MLKPFSCKQNGMPCVQQNRKYRRLLYYVRISVVCLAVAVFVFDAYVAYGQAVAKTIEAVGTSVIHKTDIETAKQQAIINGLVSAVNKVVSEIVPLKSLTQNFQVIDRTIYNETDKYVSDYKVLTEAVSGKNYRVLIQAKISMKRLRNRLETSGIMRVRKRNIQNIEIIVQGTRNLSHFINFRKGLKEIPHVKMIQVSDMRPDEANILVEFEGSSKEFTDALVLKKFDKFSIRIFEISGTRLRIELIPG